MFGQYQISSYQIMANVGYRYSKQVKVTNQYIYNIKCLLGNVYITHVFFCHFTQFCVNVCVSQTVVHLRG